MALVNLDYIKMHTIKQWFYTLNMENYNQKQSTLLFISKFNCLIKNTGMNKKLVLFSMVYELCKTSHLSLTCKCFLL